MSGREINQHNTYQITWGEKYNKNINYTDNEYLYSRVRKIEKKIELNEVYNIEVENTHTYCVNNIAVHNCQDFSLAGLQKGGDEGTGTRSSLMYETIRIVKKLKPKYIIWENVKNLLSKKHRHNFDKYLKIMEELGYTNYYQVLNAKDYGIPQNRERVFAVSILNDKRFQFPVKRELKLKLKDMLENNVNEKYYLSNKMLNFFYKNEQIQKEKGNGFRFGVSNGNVIAKTITTRAGSRMDDNFVIDCNKKINESLKIKNATKKGYLEAIEGDSINIAYPDSKTRRGRVGKQVSQTLTISDNMAVVENKLRIRKLTPKECWRLMGFDDEDFEKAEKVNSNTQLYKQAGNSIVVNVLEAIFKELFKPIICQNQIIQEEKNRGRDIMSLEDKIKDKIEDLYIQKSLSERLLMKSAVKELDSKIKMLKELLEGDKNGNR